MHDLCRTGVLSTVISKSAWEFTAKGGERQGSRGGGAGALGRKTDTGGERGRKGRAHVSEYRGVGVTGEMPLPSHSGHHARGVMIRNPG